MTDKKIEEVYVAFKDDMVCQVAKNARDLDAIRLFPGIVVRRFVSETMPQMPQKLESEYQAQARGLKARIRELEMQIVERKQLLDRVADGLQDALLGKRVEFENEKLASLASFLSERSEPFRVGDTVECVKHSEWLKVGNRYKVKHINNPGKHLAVVSDDGGYYTELGAPFDHFRRVNAKAEQPKPFEKFEFVKHAPTGRLVRIDEVGDGTAVVTEPFEIAQRYIRVRLVDLVRCQS